MAGPLTLESRGARPSAYKGKDTRDVNPCSAAGTCGRCGPAEAVGVPRKAVDVAPPGAAPEPPETIGGRR
ncbi:hypothetical protein GCM10010441_77560 [Kitasatospora paracochleata]